jgi:hypothetical protein
MHLIKLNLLSPFVGFELNRDSDNNRATNRA